MQGGMDATVTAALAKSSTRNDALPSIVIVRDDQGKAIAPSAEVAVDTEEGQKNLALRPIRELFSGNARPGDLSKGPTPELEPFFLLLEHTVVQFCDADGRDETDQDMERIYSELRRRPDGAGGRLHAYLRAAARLYMSCRDVSQAEYEAVMNRLVRSARTFSQPPLSRNYLWTLRQTLSAMTQ